jgi:hypothetical protein
MRKIKDERATLYFLCRKIFEFVENKIQIREVHNWDFRKEKEIESVLLSEGNISQKIWYRIQLILGGIPVFFINLNSWVSSFSLLFESLLLMFLKSVIIYSLCIYVYYKLGFTEIEEVSFGHVNRRV